jgi:hypothetical protein
VLPGGQRPGQKKVQPKLHLFHRKPEHFTLSWLDPSLLRSNSLETDYLIQPSIFQPKQRLWYPNTSLQDQRYPR